jgi:environmental stress-induced protein Ves
MFKIFKENNREWDKWKNGGGESMQLAISPPHSTLSQGNFDWRVSLAKIEKAGDFSQFPGYLRQLMILRGESLRLQFPESAKILQENDRIHFSGDLKVSAYPQKDKILDWGCIFLPKIKVEMDQLKIGRLRSVSSKAKFIFLYALGDLKIIVHPQEEIFQLKIDDILFGIRGENKEFLLSFESPVPVRLAAIEIY